MKQETDANSVGFEQSLKISFWKKWEVIVLTVTINGGGRRNKEASNENKRDVFGLYFCFQSLADRNSLLL
jgi:hypothetical protein